MCRELQKTMNWSLKKEKIENELDLDYINLNIEESNVSDTLSWETNELENDWNWTKDDSVKL